MQVIRPGDWVCPVHGRIRPDTGTLVPSCAQPVAGQPGGRCWWSATQAVRRRGAVVHRESQPGRCAGTERHDLGEPGSCASSWLGCPCTLVGGHTTWTCRACGDMQQWPPHHPRD